MVWFGLAMNTETTLEELEQIGTIRVLFHSGVAREMREQAGASQGETAAIAGVHFTTISKIETGTRSPRPELALKLAAIYSTYADVATRVS